MKDRNGKIVTDLGKSINALHSFTQSYINQNVILLSHKLLKCFLTKFELPKLDRGAAVALDALISPLKFSTAMAQYSKQQGSQA